MGKDFFNEVSLEHSVTANKITAHYLNSIRQDYLNLIIKEVEEAVSISLNMLALPEEDRNNLDFVYLKNCVFISNNGKILINLEHLIKGYLASMLTGKEKLQDKDYFTVSPMEVQNICEFILKNIPYGPFATNDISNHDPSFYKPLYLDYEVVTSASIRYAKEKIISELEKVGHGTYIYRLPKDKHFNDSALNRIIKAIEAEIEKPLQTSLFSDELKLMEYLTLKKDLRIILDRAKKLTN